LSAKSRGQRKRKEDAVSDKVVRNRFVGGGIKTKNP